MKVEINISIAEYIDRYSILLIKKAQGLDVDKEIEQYDDLEYPGFDYYLSIMLSLIHI